MNALDHLQKAIKITKADLHKVRTKSFVLAMSLHKTLLNLMEVEKQMMEENTYMHNYLKSYSPDFYALVEQIQEIDKKKKEIEYLYYGNESSKADDLRALNESKDSLLIKLENTFNL